MPQLFVQMLCLALICKFMHLYCHLYSQISHVQYYDVIDA